MLIKTPNIVPLGIPRFNLYECDIPLSLMDMMMMITTHSRDIYWYVQEIVGGNKSPVGVFCGSTYL